MNILKQHKSKAHKKIHEEILNKRNKIFSKFEEGIKFDESCLYTVKPERYAIRNAKYFNGETVLDLCCGIGGTSIGFAKAGKKVIGVDLNKKYLSYAKHNSKIYSVENKIDFKKEDVHTFEYPKSADCAFIDPPWGSPAFMETGEFKFEDFQIDLKSILLKLVNTYNEVGCTVPEQFDLNELKIIPAKEKILLKEEIKRLPSTKVFTVFFYRNAQKSS